MADGVLRTIRIAGAAIVGTILVVGIALGLTGCGETFEERVANREMCETAGGVYVEYTDLNYTYRDWSCDLSTQGEGAR